MTVVAGAFARSDVGHAEESRKNCELRNFGKLVVSAEGNGFCALLRNPSNKPQAFPSALDHLSPDLPRRVLSAAKKRPVN